MKEQRLIIALDGHDGAGKTTLSESLALSLGGSTIRPFAGVVGSELMKVGKNGDFKRLIEIGNGAIDKAVHSIQGNAPIILDRCWMTLASFFPEFEFFFTNWSKWIPTILCWSDLDTTLSRLKKRHNEAVEVIEWHKHYLSVYNDIAKKTNSPILRTDILNEIECRKQVQLWIQEGRFSFN